MATKTKFALHAAWLKAINADKTLRDINVKARKVAGGGVDIVHVAKIIAEGGANGDNSYVGTKALTEILGCNSRTIERMVKQLVELGWLVITATNGGEYKRGKVHTINIPVAIPADPWAADEPESNGEAAPAPDDHPAANVAGCSEHESFDSYCMYCRMKAEYENAPGNAA